jgi:hypothetical protein
MAPSALPLWAVTTGNSKTLPLTLMISYHRDGAPCIRIGVAQRVFAEKVKLQQTLVLYRFHPVLRERVQIRTSRWQPQWLGATGFDSPGK